MISAATKACYLRASVQVVGNGLKPVAPGVTMKKPISVRPNPQSLASVSLNETVPANGNIRVTSGIPGEGWLQA